MNGQAPSTIETYAAVFEDARGQAPAVIENDGQMLRLTVRGVVFEGSDFDALTPEPGSRDAAGFAFTLAGGDLAGCRLDWTMPLTLDVAGRSDVHALHVSLSLGAPRVDGGLDSETVALALDLGGVRYAGSGRHGWFEDELVELIATLPADARIRSCFTCALSDYHPVGHGLFGGLACFRDARDAYLAVHDKPSLFAVWPERTAFVQETWRCGAYEPRTAGTGYRG